MHTISPPHPQTSDCGSKTVQLFTEKNPHKGGPLQFKHVLLQVQLYSAVVKSVGSRELFLEISEKINPSLVF